MWMLLKVMLVMSAAAGVTALPVTFFSHHSQAHANDQVTVQTAQHNPTSDDIHARSSVNGHTTNGSQTTNSSQTTNQTKPGSVTTMRGTKSVVAGHHAGGSVPPVTHRSGGSHGGNGTPPLPIPPVKPQPVASIITWGKVSSVGNSWITLTPKGQSGPDKTFTVNGNTQIQFTSGPMQVVDESTPSMARVHLGDNVMMVSKGGVAMEIVDRGGTAGPYLPLGGGTAQGDMSTKLSGAQSVGAVGR